MAPSTGCARTGWKFPAVGEIQYSYLERGESVIIVPVLDGRAAGADPAISLSRGSAFCHELARRLLPRYWRIDVGRRWRARNCAKKLARRPVRLEYVTWFYSSSSISDEVCHVFLATDVTLSQETDREPGEHIEVRLAPAREVREMVRRGEMKTGTCALAFLHSEARLRDRGGSPPTENAAPAVTSL